MSNSNEPAMPTEFYRDASRLGLTKREAFTMAALQGMLGNSGIIDKFGGIGAVARKAVEAADIALSILEQSK